MSVEELRDVITSLARRVDSQLILEDSRQRLVAHSPHHTIPDERRREAIMARSLTPELIEWCEQWGIRTAEGAVRTPRDDVIGILARVCVPVRHNGTLLGYIWAIDDPSLSDDAVRELEESADEIAPQMYRDNVATRLGSELLMGLISESAELRQVSAADASLRAIFPSGTKGVLTVVLGGPIDDIEALIHREDSRAFRFAIGDEMVVLTTESSTKKQKARQLAVTILSQTPDEWDVAIGISDPHEPTELEAAYREASRAALVAATIPTEGRIAQWSMLGAYRLLARAATSFDPCETVEPRLHPIADEPELLETLETYLDLAGSVKSTSEALHLHRATLYYRLEKIEQLTGADLRTGGDRLALHISVKLLRLREGGQGT